MDCRNCGHYDLYKMITGTGAYSYSGDIPCFRCKYYGQNDEFVPVINKKVRKPQMKDK